jgi:polyphosphate kinase
MTFAPAKLRRRLRDLIDREIAWSHRGEAAHMILKMNALTDRDVIRRLYRASRAGVRVDLIVRGTCCLRPGVPTLSDRIRVRSIVGRFLEHSRAWYFRNGGREEVYLTSADLRSRNLDRRVEVAVPLNDHSLVRRVRDQVLSLCLADNVNARELSSDGTYVRVSPRPGCPAVSSQSVIRDHDALGGVA